MKGGNAMTQQEIHEKLKEARAIQDSAMKMAEESNALMDVDFKKSNEMFIESMELWGKGCEMALSAIDKAIDSGLMALTEEQEKKLCEICSETQGREQQHPQNCSYKQCQLAEPIRITKNLPQVLELLRKKKRRVIMCLFRKKRTEEIKETTQVTRGLGREFYSIFNDDIETKAEANTSERENTTLGRFFYDIFDDSVKGKNLTKEEKHRLYMEQNRKSIISAYNGDNIRELSLLYRCSQNDIITILRESIARNDKICLVNNMAEAVTQK